MNKRWVKWSISQIIDSRSDYVKDLHERTRNEWAVRGDCIHECLDLFAQGKSFDPGEYKEWADCLFADDLWNRYAIVASEYRMVDMSEMGGIGGSCDCILRHKETGDYVLADLKTLSKKGSKRNISAQLGGYVSLLKKCKPEIKIARCMAIWSWPHKTDTTTYKTNECVEKYQKLKTEFFSKQPQI
tara:strand:+ start:1784 stop:2341 length:558 start_codon:yes stop_codon:yes gene_type:complete